MYILFSPIGFIYAFIRIMTKTCIKTAFKNLSNYLFVIAISIDQKGNVIMAELFNDILIRNKYKLNSFNPTKYNTISKHLFGNEDETISSVLGKNSIKGTLTTTGKVLNWILSAIEPNHSIKSIEEDENFPNQ